MIGIVGGGLSAAKLVEGYREAGGTEGITIWSQDPHGPYHRPPLSKRLLRGEAEPADALVHPAEWYAEHGVDLRTGQHVGSLDEFDAETIVIATGARPRAFDGALALRTLDDSLELRRRAGEARTAVVVGGGFIGLEVTASLTQLGVEVTQIVREPLVFATLQAPPLSEALHERFREHGVDLRLDAEDVPAGADFVVAGVGVEPNVELGRDAGLEVRSGIVVNERFETSKPGVYASTGRTRPTTGRRSARSSPERTPATTSSRPSSPSSSAARSSRSAIRRATMRPRSRATFARNAPFSGSSATARRWARSRPGSTKTPRTS
jgi:3-phenylpropionate/trans-cinnamate dioxygenase ferredoxin reductase subunit